MSAAATSPCRASRTTTERAIHAARAAAKGPRRRRFVDPTTCDRDYGREELEFMQALDRYKRTSGRMFPTCSEILEVVRGLGYRRADGE